MEASVAEKPAAGAVNHKRARMKALLGVSNKVPPLIRVCEGAIEGICAIKDDADCMERAIVHLRHLRRLCGKLEEELYVRVQRSIAAIPELRETAALAEQLHKESREDES